MTSNATTGAYTLSLPSTVNVGNLQTNSITVGSVQIDTTGATTNQVLKFNGTKFIPAVDAGGDPSGVSYNETIGDGSNTSFVINHNLNTTEVSVEILDYSSTYEIIDALWETTSANSVTVSFAMPPASNSRRVIIDGPGDRDYYNTVVGDGVNSTIVINHNLGSRNIIPVLKSVSSPYEVIEALVYATDINSATLVFENPPNIASISVSVYIVREDENYVSSMGDGSSTSFQIDHNLGTRDIGVMVRDLASPYAINKVRWRASSTNQIIVNFSTPPSVNSKKIIAYKEIGGSRYFNNEFGLVDSDVIPSLDNVYSLGTNALRWKSISIGGGTLYITDSVTANTAAVTIANGVFNIDGIVQAQLANVKVTNLTFNDNTVQTTAYTGVSGVGGYYGSFYDTTTQTATNASVAYSMQLSNTAPETNGISITSGSRITFAYAGVYNIQFSAQLDKTDSSNDLVNIWFAKNGTPIADSNTQVTVLGNNGKYLASWNFIVSVTAGQYIEIKWQSPNVNMRIVASAAQTSPTRPAIPSVIVTAVQVA